MADDLPHPFFRVVSKDAMKLARRIFTLFCVILLVSGIWGAVWARKNGFSKSWRLRIEQEVAKRGYYVELGKLTLGPLRGLVAEDVRFFQTNKKNEEIAFVDDVYLDIDFSNVLNNKQLSIRTLDIQDAKVSLPLDPGNPESKVKLRMTNLSGRVVVTESQIEVVRAFAEIEGIEISMVGSLFRPENESGLVPTKKKSAEQQRVELQKIADRRQQIRGLLRELKRVEFLTNEVPRLDVKFRSDLLDINQMRATARFTARDFRLGNYTVKALDVNIEYDGERDRAVLKELRLQDTKGDLVLNGEWKQETNQVTFGLNSTADFKALSSQFYTGSELDEVVFFSPPMIQAEGTLLLDELQRIDRPEYWFPAEMTGKFRCDRFVSKGGKVFDSFEFDFSASANRFYIRNARLAHKSGIAQANVMFYTNGGERAFRYQSQIKMDPRTFTPFVVDEKARDFLNSWSFDKNSTVYIVAVGEGPTLDSKTWITKGVVDLRNFSLKGISFDELEASYELDGYLQTYRDIRLVRPEAALGAKEIVHDAQKKSWNVPQILSQLRVYQSESLEVIPPPAAGDDVVIEPSVPMKSPAPVESKEEEEE